MKSTYQSLFFVSLFVLAMSFSASSQNVKIKYLPELEIFNNIEKISGNTEDFFIFIQEYGKDVKLHFVSRKTYKLQKSAPLNLLVNGKEDKILGRLRGYIYKDNIVLIYGGYRKKQYNFIRFYFYNMTSGKLTHKEAFKSDIKENLSRDEMKLAHSADRKYTFLAINEKDYLLLDEKGETVYKIPNGKINHSGIFYITNRGDFVMFYDPINSFSNRERFDRKPKERENYPARNLKFQYFDEENKKMIDTDLGLSVTNDDRVSYFNDSRTESFYVFKTSRHKRSGKDFEISTEVYIFNPYKDSVSGFTFSFDEKAYPTPPNVHSLFEKEFPSMLPKIDNIKFLENGEMIITFMKSYSYIISSKNSVNSYNHFYDLYLVALDAEGNIKWETILPHRVELMNMTLGDNTWSSFSTDKYIYYLVSENTGNYKLDILNKNAKLALSQTWASGMEKENIRCYKVSKATGKFTHSLIHDMYDKKAKKVSLAKNYLYWNGETTVVNISVFDQISFALLEIEE